MNSMNRLGRRRRRAVSEVIAALMLVLIVVSTVVVVFLFGTGVIATLLAGGVSTPITASGQMTVPGSVNDNGILTLSLRNSGAQAITLINVVCPSVFTTCLSTMDYNGAPINPGLLPPGMTAIGTGPVTALGLDKFVAGTTYSILVTATFGGGSIVTLDLSVAAIS